VSLTPVVRLANIFGIRNFAKSIIQGSGRMIYKKYRYRPFNCSDKTVPMVHRELEAKSVLLFGQLFVEINDSLFVERKKVW
jgi:hypothetical protein